MSGATTEYTEIDVVEGSATSTAGAATVNTQVGVITTEALTTAAGATYVMTLTNSLITAKTVVVPTVANGTNTACGLVPITVTPVAGSVTMIFQNPGLTALNGTVKIGYYLMGF